MHIRQPEIATLRSIGKLRVIDAEGREHRRMEVVHVHWIAGSIANARRPGTMAFDIADAVGEAMRPEVLAEAVLAYPRWHRG